MEIKINGKDCELNFGVRFVRELDQHMPIQLNVQGAGQQSFGMGLAKALPALQTYDSAMLSDVIYYATWACKPRPTHQAIDEMIDDPKTDIEKLFDDVTKAMKDANAVKVAAKNLKA